MSRTTTRLTAGLAAAAVMGLSAGPAVAATPVAQASASAVVLTVGGTPADSGTYRVTHDGDRQTATGNNRPAVGALSGQSLLTAGTLAQDATTAVTQRRGSSAACAGIAGDGATVVAAGDGSCLRPGDTLSLQAGTVDLSDLRILRSTVLEGLDDQLQEAMSLVLDTILPPLSDALTQVLTELGDPALVLDVGAIQSECSATTGDARGDAQLADVAAYARVGGERVDVLAFPAHPAPNTRVVGNLSGVVDVFRDAARTQLATALDGALGNLGDAIDQTVVVDNILDNLSAELAPLEENILEGTLNRQVRRSASAIEVTALDLSVLPAATEAGLEVLRLQAGATTCGPNGRVAVAPPKPKAAPKAPVAVPVSVPAGQATAVSATPSTGGDRSLLGAASLAGLLGLSVAAGAAGYRRSLRS